MAEWMPKKGEEWSIKGEVFTFEEIEERPGKMERLIFKNARTILKAPILAWHNDFLGKKVRRVKRRK